PAAASPATSVTPATSVQVARVLPDGGAARHGSGVTGECDESCNYSSKSFHSRRRVVPGRLHDQRRHVVGEVLFTARRRGRPSEGGVRRGEGFASQRTRALDQPAASCKEGLTARVRDGCDFATLQ